MVFPATQVITELGGNLRHKMLIESDLFLRRQRKDKGIIARVHRHCRRSRRADRRQRGVEVEIQRLFVPRLAFGQTGVLLSVAKEEFELKSGLVNPQYIRRRRVQVGRRQDGVTPLAVGRMPDQDHRAQPAFERHVIQLGGIDLDARLHLRREVRQVNFVKAANVLPVNFAVVGLRASLKACALSRVT